MHKKKEILICLHGFGKKRTAELEWIQECFQNEMEIAMPNLFDPSDAKDDNGVLWTNRAYLFVEEMLAKGYQVHLLGFSMGGVIACYCASKLPVQKCILLAPAFDLINLKNVNNLLMTFRKTGAYDETQNFNHLPSSFYHTLFDVVLMYRDSAKNLEVPTLMIQGMQDSIVSYRAARHYFHQFPSKRKQLFLLEKGHHVLTEDKGVRQEVVALIRLFLNDQIILDETNEDSIEKGSQR